MTSAGRADGMIETGPGALLLIDHHCHGLVDRRLDRSRFASLLSEGGAMMHVEIDPADTPLGLAVRSLCAPIIGLESHVPFDVYIERRNELPDINQRLLAPTGVSHLLIDSGYRHEATLSPQAMATLGSFSTAEIVRIETVAEDTFVQVGPIDFSEAYETALRQSLSGAVGLKSIVAYRAGFDIDPRRPSAAELGRALVGWRKDDRLEDPIVLRHCLHVAIDLSAATGRPLQMHTGFGDRDIELWRSDPTRFTPWLRAAPPEARFCFLHCWPYHREAAFLAAVFPSVYLDTGQMNTHGALTYQSILAQTMEVAPFGKLLYSSDAFALAELFYIAALEFREALEQVLADWQRRGRCSAFDARRIANMVAHDNAHQLYRLN